EFSFADQQWLENPPQQFEIDNPLPQSAIFLGLHVPQRYDKVLDIRECFLQSEQSTLILNFTRDFARRSALPVYSGRADSGYWRFLVIRQSKRTSELMVNLVTFEDRPDIMEAYAKEVVTAIPAITTVVNTINDRKAQIAYGEKERVYYGPGIIHERMAGYLFVISASSFFQTNTAQAEKLYESAREFAGLRSTDTVYDLYSGTGTIAMAVSAFAKQIVGIESVESAIRDAERNVRENGIRNCSFVPGDLKDRLTNDKDWMASHPKPDVLIIDPPRSGMHPRVAEEVRDLSASRIVYVSCNPATQARDCKVLCENRYRLMKLQPVDMFPHTYHIENVALLEAV
ncbi:MAG TPA: 23S rRNA (uracil(1939)-C(5))-methyltransferase RlmD, partial [Bacteroidota bacterium]